MRNWNKQELLTELDKLSIERVGNTIITKFDNRIIKTSEVSDIYEVFDFVSYLKEKIDIIEKNFPIHKYNLQIWGGRQTLQLVSDEIRIGEDKFHKSFYIINSTDKSRRLSFDLGLKNNYFYSVGMTNLTLNRKHTRGVSKVAVDKSIYLNGESFDEQIENINKLIGHKVSFSKIREVILGETPDVPKINHSKFDAFKNCVRWDLGNSLSRERLILLSTPSDRINEIGDLDFSLDAYWVFKKYLQLFNREDSHIVKRETERIMKITKWFIRDSYLQKLLNV